MGRPQLPPNLFCHRGGYVHDPEGGFCIDQTEVTNADYEDSAIGQQGMSLFGLFAKECETDEIVLVDHSNDPVVLTRRYRSLIDGVHICGVEVKPLLATDLRGVPETLSGPDQPAVNVSWEEARAYCEAEGGRLPMQREFTQAYANDARQNDMDQNDMEWMFDHTPHQRHPYPGKGPQEPPLKYAAYNAQEGNEETSFRCVYPLDAATRQHATETWNKQREEYRAQVTIPYEKALGIWKKVDTFIAAAKQRDAEDFALGELMRIRNGHYRVCFGGAPSTSAEAQVHLVCASHMLGMFQANALLEAFVMEHGDCSKSNRCDSPDPTIHTHCTFGGYTFNEDSSCYPDAKPEPDYDNIPWLGGGI